MWQPLLNRSALIALFSTLALINGACGNENSTKVSQPTPSPAATATPSPTPAAKAQAPKAQPAKTTNTPTAKAQAPKAQPAKTTNTPTAKTKAAKAQPAKTTNPPNTPDTYQQALDVATSAVTISQSAVSRGDWSLVVSRWQESIKLLQAVPASSKNYGAARQKLSQYQNLLADAKQRATPPPPKPKQGDSNPQFFSIPIKGRPGGIPMIEVTFNGTQKFDMLFDTGASSTLITLGMAKVLKLQAIGLTKATVADGAQVILPVAEVASIEIDGRLKRKVKVAVAPPEMPIGLLGQDFFEGYDVTIKQDAIEFRRNM